MASIAPSRNSSCPCGSGLKYKRCCLAHEREATRLSRLDDAVGRRIEDWSAEALQEEITPALAEFIDAGGMPSDDEMPSFAIWFHNDRELPGGIELVRRIENSGERARRRGEPAPDVTWVRPELGLDDELAA